jgi:hypothetical protein
MNRKEIIDIVSKCDSTLLSFPDRGSWGTVQLQRKLFWIHPGISDMEIQCTKIS